MLVTTTFTHLWLLIVLVLLAAAVVAAIVATVRSGAMTQTTKVVWILVLALVPVLGLLLWAIIWLANSRRNTKDAHAA
jgi:hypothetical protein